MARATLKVKSNEGLVSLSNAHPGTRFKVLGAWPTGENIRLLVETTEIDPDALEETLTAVATITEHEFRHSDSEPILFEVSTPAPEPHGAMADSGIVPSFPTYVEAGWQVGDLIASRETLSAFRDELLDGEIEHEIVQVTAVDDEPCSITERQRDVVELAVERGYYDSPRECTLTELARDLEVNKSVVSRVLHRAEGRIVRAYCSSATDRAHSWTELDA